MKYIVNLNGKNYEVEVEETTAAITAVTDTPQAQTPAPKAQPVPEAPPANAPVSAGEGEIVTAPMPGTILSVDTSVGSRVNSGDVLMILEAMKMENEIICPRDGVISTLFAAPAKVVDTGVVLCTIK